MPSLRDVESTIICWSKCLVALFVALHAFSGPILCVALGALAMAANGASRCKLSRKYALRPTVLVRRPVRSFTDPPFGGHVKPAEAALRPHLKGSVEFLRIF
ncbi:unnamed protein product [Durusdinium trenchii]|uniref:Secreted protein n=1 Tax=Durusdinium trenchii TaxID=1381693 RepID=A0ABP0KJ75_9DINO